MGGIEQTPKLQARSRVIQPLSQDVCLCRHGDALLGVGPCVGGQRWGMKLLQASLSGQRADPLPTVVPLLGHAELPADPLPTVVPLLGHAELLGELLNILRPRLDPSPSK